MSVEFTLRKFPATGAAARCWKRIQLCRVAPPSSSHHPRNIQKCHAAGDLKDECGLPFACVVQPFARTKFTSLDRPCAAKAKDVARCSECYACASFPSESKQLEPSATSPLACGAVHPVFTMQPSGFVVWLADQKTLLERRPSLLYPQLH